MDDQKQMIKESIEKIDRLLKDLSKKESEIDEIIHAKLKTLLESEYQNVPSNSPAIGALKRNLISKYRAFLDEKIRVLKHEKEVLSDLM